MKKEVFNLRIEKVLNGYIVYENENVIDLNSVTARKTPYVFETLVSLFVFIENNLTINENN